MTTLHDIASSLPNGLHDAMVHSAAFDFDSRVVTLQLDVWIGDVDAPTGGGRETYRPARLELHGVAYLAMEPPDARYDYAEAGPLRVDLCDPDPGSGVPAVRAGDFAARFFVDKWNAFMSVSARRAVFEWSGSAFEGAAMAAAASRKGHE